MEALRIAFLDDMKYMRKEEKVSINSKNLGYKEVRKLLDDLTNDDQFLDSLKV